MIRDLADRLIAEIENKVQELSVIDNKLLLLESKGIALLEKEKRIDKKIQDFESQNREMLKEKEYIKQANEKMNLTVKEIDRKTVLLDEKKRFIEEQDKSLDAKIKIANQKMEEVFEFEDNKNQFNKSLDLLKKEQEVLSKEKEDILIREQAVRIEALRLKKIAERYQIK